MEFVTLSTLPGIIGRYLMMLKVTDILDIAIMVFVFYKALTLIQSTRAASLLKGVLVFLAALMLSMVLNMNSINFIMNQLVRWGVVALIVLFQPEIRRILEEVGSRRFIAFFSRAEAGTAVEQAIDQTVLACTEMSQSRTGALIVFERENLLDDMVRSGTPPALSLLTVNAYVATDSLIIPMSPEILSLLGVSQIKETIESVRSYYNSRLRVLGILLNKFSARLTLNREVLEMAEQIAAQLDTRVFQSKIRGSVSVAESPAHGVSVLDYAPRSKPSLDFEALCEEIAGGFIPHGGRRTDGEVR